MARRAGYTRIERNVIREFGSYQGNAIKLLQAEHARAVRIVKGTRKQYCPEHPTTEYQQGYMAACIDILTVLTKGRA